MKRNCLLCQISYADVRYITVPNDGCLNFVDENDEVLLAGFGRKGKAKGDIPGVRFKVVKVSGVGLSAYVPILSLPTQISSIQLTYTV